MNLMVAFTGEHLQQGALAEIDLGVDSEDPLKKNTMIQSWAMQKGKRFLPILIEVHILHNLEDDPGQDLDQALPSHGISRKKGT